jgi:prolyl oligopeptidase
LTVPESLPTPPATRLEPVQEEFHGEVIIDPYRWLEDGGSAEVQAWVASQNTYAEAVLSRVPGREAIARRLGELLAIGTVSAPVVRHGRYFYQRRDLTQNQPVLYVRNGVNGQDRVLLDPNALSADGTVALDWYYPSRDGRLVAYGLSASGDELSTLHVIDVDSGEALPETISRSRYTSLAWLPDGSGFYYVRLPAPGSVPAGEEQYHRRVYLHHLGDDPDADRLIWSERDDMREFPSVDLSLDGRWLLLTANLGWDRTDVYVCDLSQPAGHWLTVAAGERALHWGEVCGDTLYLFTNDGAPRYRVVAVPLATPQREHWREIVPERQDRILVGGRIVGGRLALNCLMNACSRLEIRSLDGAAGEEVLLPGLGSVAALSGEQTGDELFFQYTSFTTPMTVYRLDLMEATLGEWAAIAPPLGAAQVEVQQVWYRSRDGARVSMFVIGRGLQRNANAPARPTLLTGYGGFNINLVPEYSGSLLLWLERGGICAIPNLRGGGEYGEAWHRAGMLEQKQHTFDDFIAAAEFLIAAGYTSSERLGIRGGSNGGLLVGAAITQRPDLFRAAVCQVPLLDMLRYHRFLIARLWISEYGSAEDAEQYAWLRAYSPYHHVAEGVRYPAVLFTTADSDSRVDPLHARKMGALLQARQAAPCDQRPVLLRTETHAGHGQGKPLTKVIEEQIDVWSFLTQYVMGPASRPQ